MGKVMGALMKFFKILMVFLFVACLIIGGIFIVKQKKKSLMAEKPPVKAPLPVKTSTIIKGAFYETRRYLGTLQPQVESSIASQINGQLLKLTAREGDYVKKGELLAELDSRQQRAKVHSISAQLKAARSSLATYKSIYERDKVLFKNRAISREAFDRSKSAYDNALAKVRELESLLSSANVELSYTKVVAPFDGIVTAKLNEKGGMALAGKPIFQIESIHQGYKLALKVPQKLFPRLKIGMPVEILPPKANQKSLNTQISRIYPGQLPSCEIDLSSRPFGLPSGSHLYVAIKLRKIEGFILPARAILEQATGQSLVFVLDDQDQVEKVAVKILGRSADSVCVDPVNEDLDGKKVVTAGEDILLMLKKGQRVKPILQNISEEI